MDVIKKLWKGDFGLAKTFWLFWFIPTFVLGWLVTSDTFRLLIVNSMSISAGLSASLAYGVPILLMIFHIFMSIVSWKTSSKYQGNKFWPILTKLYVALFVGIIAYSNYSYLSIDREDSGMDSSIVSEFLTRDPAYPYVGFWKGDCKQNFGLSIDKVSDGFYSISFCGPGGCFKPGTYRPNSKIEDDPNYKILDKDTIQVKGLDGFSTYYRCQ